MLEGHTPSWPVDAEHVSLPTTCNGGFPVGPRCCAAADTRQRVPTDSDPGPTERVPPAGKSGRAPEQLKIDENAEFMLTAV